MSLLFYPDDDVTQKFALCWIRWIIDAAVDIIDVVRFNYLYSYNY